MYKKTSLLLALVALMGTVPAVFANTAPPSVPDAGSSALLLTAACGGLLAVRRFFAKRG
jgi:hypothetical protein